jgi:hypothetical protein
MNKLSKPCALIALALLSALMPAQLWGADPVNPGSQALHYNRDIRPILSENCFACHGPDKAARKADLRLDQREIAVKSGAINPGHPEQSELVERIFSEDAAQRMPPAKAHKTLTAGQKALLRKWIEAGAEYEPHWAYIVPTRPAVPSLGGSASTASPIDAFILAALKSRQLEPAPEADRRTLLRRLSLDLIGLPPSVDELEAFLADQSADAYEKQVDRLLKSPHYGERMAQPWLDVARYADTVGYHGDQNQHVWPYRDYVIKSFNDNKPFDQFTLEQLAGDLLPNPTEEQRTATCFLRLNMMTREGGAQPKEYLAKYTADRVRTVAMAWLGSTFACCECHDHKFDPIKTKDFYSLGAFFGDLKQWGVYQDYDYTPNPDLPGWSNDHPWPPEIFVRSAALERRIEKLKQEAAAVAKRAGANEALAATWLHDSRRFLEAHPSGWETPRTAAVHIEPARPRRSAAKASAGASPGPSNAQIEKDQRILFGPDKGGVAVIDVAPEPGNLAAVRLELLPDERYGQKITRNGGPATIRVSMAIQHLGGASEPANARIAIADRYAPRYSNGFEILGVQDAWKLDGAALDRPHTAVFLLAKPVQLGKGDRLQIRVAENVLSSVKVATSPLAPMDVLHPERPPSFDKLLGDKSQRNMLHLRSTAHDAAAYRRLSEIDKELLSYREGRTPVMVAERTAKPLTIRVLARGNWMDESGEICRPAPPQFLPHKSVPANKQLTRLDLARWLCAPENPLTARVIMNRLWRDFFGTGLSAQVDDLGAQGEPPSHPELLDWLAVEFRESEWNLKHMVKLIVMSHTYRQSSKPRPEAHAVDPNNRLLAAQTPRRLDAEFIRDNALAIAGLIDLEVGGPPAKPYQPAHYYDGLQFPDRQYVADRGPREYRRGVYIHWQRTFLHPMLANFDASGREDCLATRSTANSPQQALTLLNDPEFVEAARVWGGKLLQQKCEDDRARIALAYQQALGRLLTEQETRALTNFVTGLRKEYRERPADAEKLLGVGIAKEPKGDPVEQAAWASVCRVILNLHETITRY